MTKSITAIQAWFLALKDEDGGATMVEYGLMLALIATICLTAIALIGTNANTMFNDIAGRL